MPSEALISSKPCSLKIESLKPILPLRFLVTEKELFHLTQIGVVFISRLIFLHMENDRSFYLT